MADRETELLFREVDEELRQEQFAKIWKKYGNLIIGAAVLVVIGVAGFQAWRAYDHDRRAEQSALFTTALRAVSDDKPSEAAALLGKLAESASSGYKQLALLDSAAVKAREGKSAEAAADFLKLAGDDSLDPNLRNIALLLSVVHETDTGDPKALSDRLQPLTAGNSPWRHSAKELMAVLAHKMGDKTRASEMFRELADDATAPQGVRSRAAEMYAALGG